MSEMPPVPILNGPLIVKEKAWAFVARLLSVTVAVNVLIPAEVGTPLIMPVKLSRERPAGRAPEVTAQVYGAVPPVLASVLLKRIFVMPLTRLVVVIVKS